MTGGRAPGWQDAQIRGDPAGTRCEPANFHASHSTCAWMSVDPRLFAETLQQLRGKLEARALGWQRARDAQLQRALEAVLARAFLDHAHQRRRINPRTLLEQHRAALRT